MKFRLSSATKASNLQNKGRCNEQNRQKFQNAPVAPRTRLNELTIEPSASLTAPPTTGTKLPIKNLAPFATALSAAPARRPLIDRSPTKTVDRKPSVIVTAFLMILVIPFQSKIGESVLTILKASKIPIDGFRKTEENCAIAWAKPNKSVCELRASAGFPLAATIAAYTGNKSQHKITAQADSRAGMRKAIHHLRHQNDR